MLFEYANQGTISQRGLLDIPVLGDTYFQKNTRIIWHPTNEKYSCDESQCFCCLVTPLQ